ncbi:hypothetical protein F0L17_08360 [Streptomyces sp. TRM43335]|uniref:Uncharacterized protein n=1 Tax=Streptomyces taklimakanensis TaxID=2569853 RepID=A0A6G2BA55_9ACTN|nr:hypothetical protein [Streptomyces taklimakanensis]MTE19140.1 hypothetical protein [Streptomyces taklimakanensis]
MRNAVEYALTGSLLAMGALGLSAGVALAAPAPHAPPALVLPAAPERAAQPVATSECGPGAPGAPGAVGAVDGRDGNAAGAGAEVPVS